MTVLSRQFTKTLCQFFYSSTPNKNLQTCTPALFEQLEESKLFWDTFTGYFNKWTLSRKRKISCSLKTTTPRARLKNMLVCRHPGLLFQVHPVGLKKKIIFFHFLKKIALIQTHSYGSLSSVRHRGWDDVATIHRRGKSMAVLMMP